MAAGSLSGELIVFSSAPCSQSAAYRESVGAAAQYISGEVDCLGECSRATADDDLVYRACIVTTLDREIGAVARVPHAESR